LIFRAEADCQSAIQQAASLRYGKVGAKPKGEVIADILASIKERRA
jgi:hypothetical protein